MLGPVTAPVLSVKDRPEPLTTVVLPVVSLDVRPALLILVLPVVTEPLVPRSIFSANLTVNVSVPFAVTTTLLVVPLPVVPPITLTVVPNARLNCVPVSPLKVNPLLTVLVKLVIFCFTSNN